LPEYRAAYLQRNIERDLNDMRSTKRLWIRYSSTPLIRGSREKPM
jgi:hypothetical protein